MPVNTLLAHSIYHFPPHLPHICEMSHHVHHTAALMQRILPAPLLLHPQVVHPLSRAPPAPQKLDRLPLSARSKERTHFWKLIHQSDVFMENVGCSAIVLTNVQKNPNQSTKLKDRTGFSFVQA